MQNIRFQFIAIIVVTLVLGYIVAPVPNKPAFLKDVAIQKGIDIAGGAELEYRLLFPPDFKGDKKQAAQRVVEVLQNRINTKGLKEPRITTHGDDKVVVQLAGVDRDALEDFKGLISKVGSLELKKEAPADIAKQYEQNPDIVPEGYAAVPMTEGKGGSKILVAKAPVITGEDVADAKYEPSLQSGGGYVVVFELKSEGAKKFDDAAVELYRREPRGRIAIIMDGVAISAPVVNSESFHGRGEISGGNMGEAESKNIAITLKSGSLPVPIGKLENGQPLKAPEAQNFLGPTLGQDAIQRGLIACLVAFLGVALFMVVYYRAGGVIAVVSLILNLTFLTGIMALFGATLTLPGIAGIALTAGMAVDANILIFERMREELAKGKTLMQAFEAGHDRAFVTIVDANLTTLIAGIVLYYFGTGPVQGFAVTLSIGILTTLVSTLWCSKVFLEILINRGTIREMKMMKMLSQPNYNFVRWLNAAVAVSLIAIVGSMVVFGVRGADNFGTDFRGGARLVFALTEKKPIDDVRKTVHAVKDSKTGLGRYEGAEVTTMSSAGTATANASIYQLRDQTQDIEQLSQDVQDAFEGSLQGHRPFRLIRAPSPEIPAGSRFFPSGPAGGILDVYLQDDGKFNFDEAKKLILERGRGNLDTSTGDVELKIERLEKAPKGLIALRLILSKNDTDRPDDRLAKMREAIKDMGWKKQLNLCSDPFLAAGTVGPTVAQELKTSSIWAMLISWILMIAYIAVRFSSWRFGVAAVLALVHDSLVSIGFVSVLGAIVPKSWGLSFDMNMTFVAAILTIIGYSINDTIVIYDRIRENLGIMKKETFAEIINVSVNQTLSRTILTSLTVWITCIVLYVATATSGGGIAEFALPMIIGVITGTYSSVYIAAPICLWWYGKTKPQIA